MVLPSTVQCSSTARRSRTWPAASVFLLAGTTTSTSGDPGTKVGGAGQGGSLVAGAVVVVVGALPVGREDRRRGVLVVQQLLGVGRIAPAFPLAAHDGGHAARVVGLRVRGGQAVFEHQHAHLAAV